MSLDIYLKSQPCPHCKREAEELHWQNITHNLNKMAAALDIYEILWHPPLNTTAKDLIRPLQFAIGEMIAHPNKYKQYDAPNGWGLYIHFLPWLQKLLAACEEHPTATITVSI
jgi:hypothetical protein